MRWAGLVVWQAHQIAARLIRPGVTTFQINAAIERYYETCHAEPLFLNYPHYSPGKPPFPAASCMSANDAVVHGIPNHQVLQDGDILSIDTGCRFNGWCGDAALTHPIGNVVPAVQKLLDVTQATLDLAIDLLHHARMWSEVADQMAHYVQSHGFSTVECFVGHGIGRNMHEDPQVPNYVSRSIRGSGDFRIEPGLVLAIEPMVNAGNKRIKLMPDQWTQVTKDGSPSAHFEHTIAITADGPICLTGPPTPEEVASAPFPIDPEVIVSW
ncbi:MAG: type I methionyl aminopeptidase [Pirellulales bacterium]|nr:type I methionyl aminopeptidase [Pirellulales bacterium]